MLSSTHKKEDSVTPHPWAYRSRESATPEEISGIDLWWRGTNYLSVGHS